MAEMTVRRALLAALVVVGLRTPAAAQDPAVEQLAPSVAASHLAAERTGLSGAEQKLDGHLRGMARPRTRSLGGPTPVWAPAPAPWQQGADAHVYVRVDAGGSDVPSRLRGAGLRITHEGTGGLVEGWVRGADLGRLGALTEVRSVRPVWPARLRAGSVTSQGDAASKANLARATGFDGTGVKVGVISDGVNGLAASKSSGNVPSSTAVPVGTGCSAGSGDEGTAMLEIVHDLAPGATLAFSEGLTSSLAFINSVTCLRNAGAQVIVDDLGFYDEPFFADGPVALAAKAAVQAGVSFHSAAGNDADRHLQQAFRPTAGSTFHDFLGGPVDNTDDLTVGPGQEVDCVLQWNDPWGASTNNYDLVMLDASLNPIDSSTTVQNGSQDPIEIVGAVNLSGTSQTAKVSIQKVSGQDRTLAMFCFGASTLQYVTAAGSIVGHPAVPEVVGVGAIDVGDSGLNDVEFFSSQGPVTISFPSAETRVKPDLAAFDGVSTAVSGFSPFFGTSAAAPHSAAVAALVLSKNSCRSPAQVQSTLKSTAVDIGAFGFDGVSGAGRIDALAAVTSVGTPECAVDGDCNDANACTTDVCSGCLCVHTPVVCDDHDPCTADTCDTSAGCQHSTLPDGTPCPDATLCNGGETCLAGVCIPGTPLVCDDDEVCTIDTCDPVAGCVFTPDPCDDDDPCTADSCELGVGCQHSVVADGTSCADGDPCNGDEVCVGGECTAGDGMACDDGDECSVDSCAPDTGCTHEPLEGFDGTSCLCDRGLVDDRCTTIPGSLGRRFARACGLLARAAEVGSPRRARQLVRGAVKLLTRSAHLARRGPTHKRLAGPCADGLEATLNDAIDRATLLLQTL
jgi:subtilisin family serine protease